MRQVEISDLGKELASLEDTVKSVTEEKLETQSRVEGLEAKVRSLEQELQEIAQQNAMKVNARPFWCTSVAT